MRILGELGSEWLWSYGHLFYIKKIIVLFNFNCLNFYSCQIESGMEYIYNKFKLTVTN